MGEPGALLATFPATTRVRSTTRPSRLLVPSASTEDAFVKIAGATMAVSTANGLLATTWYCMLALPFSAAHPSRQHAPQTSKGFFSLRENYCGYCLMDVTCSPVNFTKIVLSGGCP